MEKIKRMFFLIQNNFKNKSKIQVKKIFFIFNILILKLLLQTKIHRVNDLEFKVFDKGNILTY